MAKRRRTLRKTTVAFLERIFLLTAENNCRTQTEENQLSKAVVVVVGAKMKAEPLPGKGMAAKTD